MRCQSISSQTELVHDLVYLCNSLSAYLTASVHNVSIKHSRNRDFRTFLDVEIPHGSSTPNHSVGDALDIGKGDFARFQAHLCGSSGKWWEECTEHGEER
jgi:hypothetical protein